MNPQATGRKWRVSALAHEASANVSTWGSRASLLLIAASLLASCIGAVSYLDWRNLRDEQQDAYDRGGRTLVFSVAADDGPGIDQYSCATLANLEAVRHSGHITTGNTTQVQQLSGGAIPVVYMSTSLAIVEGAAQPVASTSLSAIRPALLRTSDGDLLDMISFGNPPLPARVSQTLRRLPGTSTESSLVVLESPRPGSFSPICAAVLNSTADAQLARDIAAAQLQVAGPEPFIEFADPSFDQAIDRHLRRVTRHTAFASSSLLVLVFVVVTRSRNSELAAYRFAGSSRLDVFMMLTFESLLVAGTGLFVTAVTLGGLAYATDEGHLAGLRTGVIAWATAHLACTAYSASTSRRSAIVMAKDR